MNRSYRRRSRKSRSRRSRSRRTKLRSRRSRSRRSRSRRSRGRKSRSRRRSRRSCRLSRSTGSCKVTVKKLRRVAKAEGVVLGGSHKRSTILAKLRSRGVAKSKLH